MTTINSLQNTFKIFTETFHYLKKSENQNLNIDVLKSEWAHKILEHLHVELNVQGNVFNDGPMLLLGNHISYLDIPILMSQVSEISFVAKQELKSWPLFGAAATQVNTVFLQRDNRSSRSLARESIKTALKNGQRIAIFPSGTTSINESKIWRRGAFEIAHDLGIPVQFFRLSYKPLRQVAYIDKDFFPLHLYKLGKSKKIIANIEFSQPTLIQDPAFDCLKWNYWSRGFFDDELH